MAPLRVPRRAPLAAFGAATLSGCTFALPALRREPRLGPLADRQVLRLALGGEPETLDPARISFVDEIGVVMRVFANLLAFDAKGALVPELAERLPVVSADGKTLTFSLRPGLLYSDGRSLAAGDFAFSWRRHVDPRTAGPYAFAGQVVESVRAPDHRTVEFRLRSPAPWFPSVVTTWCGVPLREDVVSRPDWTEPHSYVGCGPYVLASRERQNRIVLEANPRYHRGAPILTSIELITVGEPAVALAAFRSDELDIIGLRREDSPLLQQDAALRRQHQLFPAPCTTFLAFNTTRAPFSQVGVRRALAASLDREALVAGALGGVGTPAAQLVPAGLPGHYQDVRGQKRDITAARKHMADAGFPDTARLPPVRIVYAGGVQVRARADALAEQLRRSLGVAALAEPMEGSEFVEATRSAASAPSVYLSGWCQDYPDPHAWYSAQFHSRSPLNSTGWSSPEVDWLLDEAGAEANERRRNELYCRVAQVIADDAPLVFLYYDVVSRLVKPWVHGLTPNPLELYEGQANTMSLRILKH